MIFFEFLHVVNSLSMVFSLKVSFAGYKVSGLRLGLLLCISLLWFSIILLWGDTPEIITKSMPDIFVAFWNWLCQALEGWCVFPKLFYFQSKIIERIINTTNRLKGSFRSHFLIANKLSLHQMKSSGLKQSHIYHPLMYLLGLVWCAESGGKGAHWAVIGKRHRLLRCLATPILINIF